MVAALTSVAAATEHPTPELPGSPTGPVAQARYTSCLLSSHNENVMDTTSWMRASFHNGEERTHG
jgi:hypothetical protein